MVFVQISLARRWNEGLLSTLEDGHEAGHAFGFVERDRLAGVGNL